jgi:NAD-dependent deacetylase
MPLEMDAIYDALLAADLFVAIGTSGSVYPAAGSGSEARGHRIHTCEINLEPSDNARQFNEQRYGSTSTVRSVSGDQVTEHRSRHVVLI